MATQREIESKLEVSVDLVLPDLAGLPGVTSVDGPEVFELEAVYVDTADLRLAQAGMTLRRRTGGSDAGWHLKIPVSVDERTEIQAPLGPVDGQVPGELLAVARSQVGDAQLGPVVLLHTRRSVRRLHDAWGRVLVEVADDVVTTRAPISGEVLDQWREWEVELVEGDRGLLAAAVELLKGAGATGSGWSSKLARALGDRLTAAEQEGTGEAPDPGLTDPVPGE